MSDISEQIKKIAQTQAKEIIGIRQHLHMYPELSFKEFETAKFIAQALKELGVDYEEGIANTGILATIRGLNPDKKVVGLRADIDALPIVEANNVAYKSRNEGVMHACGHDVHTSSLIGTAHILNQLKDKFEGTIKLIFQPAEEKAPGGASLMIKAGVLENPKVSSILAQHVAPLIPVGKVGFKSGMYMASTDEIYMRIIGKGGHGAAPHLAVDPIVVASNIIVALQQIISRNRNPATPSVLTFGRIVGDGITNVIPNEVYLEGTFRCMDERWRSEGLQKIQKMAEAMAEAMGARCEFWLERGYPFLQNEPKLTARTRSVAEEYLGKENVIDLDLWMGGEDFAYYSQVTDACFYRLGTQNESKGITSGVHTPTFDIDESALEIGSGLMSYLIIKELKV